ncbi:hypothetical protein [Desertibacillus haloalkaliphilus]|uniref:hypothetical protein n=1 Tax=Desertibacillus haloalkaliphilus TaxID=1328930 RepID=UPI001C2798B8|nr:hypothetical protein [Desertibacillus haloalkaliphilus]MBU8907598.1 hypothetical protein [Desertibacillus haloalkaliphilus]
MAFDNSNKENEERTASDHIGQIFTSLVEDERALVSLIEEHTKQLNRFVGKHADFPTDPSPDDIQALAKSNDMFLNTVFMKQWLQVKKVEALLQIWETSLKEEDDIYHQEE